MIESGMGKIVSNKFEYLRPDIKPIMACIGDNVSYENIETENLRESNVLDDIEEVNFHEIPPKLNEKGFKNAGFETYVISRLNSKNKFSQDYNDCTGVVVAGKDKLNNKNISFLTHQNPQDFLNKHSDKFIADLGEMLDEIKERSQEKTIDVVIVGGNHVEHKIHDNLKENYIKSIKLLDKIIFKKLGFHPNVIVGPKITGGEENIVYDNEDRKLYIGRGSLKDTPATINYNAADLAESEKNNWQFPQKN